jgi:hypothetical protein
VHRDVQILDHQVRQQSADHLRQAVPAGKEVEMCRLTSGGDKYVRLLEGQADCLKLSE